MRTFVFATLVLVLLNGCTTSNADVVLLKTLTSPAKCTAPARGACGGCETACPALKQALCIDGTGTDASTNAPAACTRPASCSCL